MSVEHKYVKNENGLYHNEHWGVCPHCGYVQLGERGMYVDPGPDPKGRKNAAGFVVQVGWGGSYFEYFCRRCNSIIEVRENRTWYGAKEEMHPLSYPSRAILKYYDEVGALTR